MGDAIGLQIRLGRSGLAVGNNHEWHVLAGFLAVVFHLELGGGGGDDQEPSTCNTIVEVYVGEFGDKGEGVYFVATISGLRPGAGTGGVETGFGIAGKDVGAARLIVRNVGVLIGHGVVMPIQVRNWGVPVET